MKAIITEYNLMVHLKVWLVSTCHKRNWNYSEEGTGVRFNL